MNLFDNSDIEIPCPHCGKKSKQRLGGLNHNQDFTCPHCRQVSTLDTKGFDKGQKAINDSLDDFARAISKLGK